MQFIPLTKGKHAIVDDGDFDVICQHKWYATRSSSNWYARRGVKGGTVYMHRQIMDCPAGKQVHHDDGDGLNNRKENLCIVTSLENCSYRRKYRGA